MIILLYKRCFSKPPKNPKVLNEVPFPFTWNKISITDTQTPPSWGFEGFHWRDSDKEPPIKRLSSLNFASCYFGHWAWRFREHCSVARAWPEMLWTQNKISTCRRRIYFCPLIFQIAMKLQPGLRNKVTMHLSCTNLPILWHPGLLVWMLFF